MATQRIRRSAFRLHEGHSYSCSIAAVGNVPLNQTFLQSANEYDFDRMAVPLTVTPSITMDGADLDLTKLTAKAWYEVASDGTETQITSADTDFVLYPTGYPCGLQVKKNGNVNLVFRAKNGVDNIMAKVSARMQTAAEPQLELELDAPTAQTWNPFVTGHDELTITPRAHRGGKTVPATIKWQRIRDGVWADLNPYMIGDATTDALDCDVSIDATTHALTIDRRFMGESAYLRCMATHDGSTRTIEVSITRRIPEYSVDTIMSGYLPDAGDTIHADAYIRYVGGGRITNPSKELLISWYVNGASTPSGHGNGIDIKSTGDRMDVEMTVEDRGALHAISTGNPNEVFCDSDGKILFI